MIQSTNGADITDQTPDGQLVAAAQHALPAFEHLYRRHVQEVYRYCARRLSSEMDAADATSQVFTRALTNIRSCQPETFRPWLYTIARNVVIDHYRAARPVSVLDEALDIADETLGPEDLTILSDQRRTVERALTQLPDGERSVIELRLAGLSAVEIAAALGKTRNAIDQAQFRAIARLRDLLCPANLSKGASR